jgi:4-amino-4-deoxy-L-arabinose transferase-like glycosyltransferase
MDAESPLRRFLPLPHQRPANGLTLVLILITGAGAVLRFATLGEQSYWYDEAVTVTLVQKSFGGMISTLPHIESTPPLPYVLQWIWARIFGTSEMGLRSLSALMGTATIPVAYGVARAYLRDRRLALAVAAVTAVSPIMVWYSQEARSYALYALLSAASLLFLRRALDTQAPRDVWWWAAVSLLAAASHYFAAFLVLGEALWLVVGIRLRRCGPQLLAVAVGLASLAVLARKQNEHLAANSAISSSPLLERVREVGVRFTVLYYNPGRSVTLAVALVLAIVLIARGLRRAHAGGILLLGACELVLPLALSLLGVIDVFFFRNVLAAWLPLTVAVAAGIPVTRVGLALTSVVCAGLLASTLAVAARESLQRDSWRQAARELQRLHGPRVIVGDQGELEYVLHHYWPTLPRLPGRGATVREIDLVGRYVTTASRLRSLPEFFPVELRTAGNMAILRLRSARRVRVTPARIREGGYLGGRIAG